MNSERCYKTKMMMINTMGGWRKGDQEHEAQDANELERLWLNHVPAQTYSSPQFREPQVRVM